MTTTVIRNPTGAVQRIPSGALRRKRAELFFVHIAFCNETSSGYWNSGNHPESPENIAARALWNAHVTTFESLTAQLLDIGISVSSQVVGIPDSVQASVLKPPDEPYPPDVVVKSILKFPSKERFTAVVTDDGTAAPHRLFVDSTGSMYEGEHLLEPGLSEYISDPLDGVAPRVDYFGAERDEEWMNWLNVGLVFLLANPP